MNFISLSSICNFVYQRLLIKTYILNLFFFRLGPNILILLLFILNSLLRHTQKEK